MAGEVAPELGAETLHTLVVVGARGLAGAGLEPSRINGVCRSFPPAQLCATAKHDRDVANTTLSLSESSFSISLLATSSSVSASCVDRRSDSSLPTGCR